MKEHTPSHESHSPRDVPRLDQETLVDYVKLFYGEPHFEPEINRMILGERLDELLDDMRTCYPSVVNRAERMLAKIEQGINNPGKPLSPDAKNFSNCYIIAYGMMREAYTQNSISMPGDSTQRPWFDDPMIVTVEDTFSEINHCMQNIVGTYQALPEALNTYLDITHSHERSPYARGMATFAAAEMYDAFVQLEAANCAT